MSKTIKSACDWLAACIDVLAVCAPDLCGPPPKKQIELNYGNIHYKLTTVLSRAHLQHKAEQLRLRGRTLQEGTGTGLPREYSGYVRWAGAPHKRPVFSKDSLFDLGEDPALTNSETLQNIMSYKGVVQC
jgi:hypothetical protein